MTDPLLGTLVDGRYEVISRIARGGMATVYLAVDRRLDRQVALKVMHPHLADGAEGNDFIARFRREAQSAARLTHPGLVSVYDQGVDGETSYLTMEYVPGTNLRQRLALDGPFSIGRTFQILEDVLEALSVAHLTGLVHRDIKPENVLLATDGRTKVADFGLARAITEATVTTTGTILGTVAYLGPELVSQGLCDARTDVYAVGILCYEMLTGRQPFTGETPIQVAFQHVNNDIPAPSLLISWLPIDIDELVAALAAREPAERPRDAGAALELVRRVRSRLDPELLAQSADLAPEIPPTVPNRCVRHRGRDLRCQVRALGEQLRVEPGPDPADQLERGTRVPGALGRFACGEGRDELVDVDRQPADQQGRRRDVVVDVLERDLDRRLAGERLSSGQHLVPRESS